MAFIDGANCSVDIVEGKATESVADQAELKELFKNTYGDIKRPRENSSVKEYGNVDSEKKNQARDEYFNSHPNEKSKKDKKNSKPKKKYLLVDGYNVIFAWKELKELARDNIDSARDALLDILCNYQGYTGVELIAVFDAYKVKEGKGYAGRYNNIYVVYTKEAQTADAYIERTTHDIIKSESALVSVVSSDNLVQTIVTGSGALRISAREFKTMVMEVKKENG